MKKLFVVVVCTALTGCANKNKDGSAEYAPSKEERARKEASKTQFETMKDPPISHETRVVAAQFAESQGNTANAIAQYREAVKEEPRDLQSMYRLAVLLTASREHTEAIEVWKRYAKLTKNSATAWSNLGFCYELSGQLDEAEKAYREGIKREPTNRICRINFGLMLARLDRRDEAAKQLETVLSPAEVQYNIASVYEQVGRKPEAREAYRQALKIDPEYRDAQLRLAALD